ncbi:hypothetical protein GCM10012278_70690 [Nonomuraea glycinis]|uniref:Uncharacterized protein n=1 Tax=Nonomuraea glycinis TaxID=2047744 RepID=A0A918ACN8_9ACTN|nr:hypothetical protein GCM10012278_70690 [Nonomuraea glycinis]
MRTAGIADAASAVTSASKADAMRGSSTGPHIVWQAGAGRQLLPRLHQRIDSEKSRPLRPAGTFFEEGECDTWPGYRIDVVGREPPFVGESYGGSLEA